MGKMASIARGQEALITHIKEIMEAIMKEIISRQLKYQRKMMEQERCPICGKPAIPGTKYCVKCWLNQYIKNKKTSKRKSVSNSKTIKALQLLVNEDWERRIRPTKDKAPSPFTVYG